MLPSIKTGPVIWSGLSGKVVVVSTDVETLLTLTDWWQAFLVDGCLVWFDAKDIFRVNIRIFSSAFRSGKRPTKFFHPRLHQFFRLTFSNFFRFFSWIYCYYLIFYPSKHHRNPSKFPKRRFLELMSQILNNWWLIWLTITRKLFTATILSHFFENLLFNE